uniref:Nudix hydrolase domain-containing protein n=1 Tax=Cyclophora tenuis TaxID=216820 RepID=A0A7S1GKX4_CYCTE|mmetsp:Transcript_24307/g.41285  ORF Transcript_24307/g.41285 Transcript_24307/m.41285 type:complete len:234 (+) Transcript_24307:18-719(+)
MTSRAGVLPILASFSVGVAVASLYSYLCRKKEDRNNAGAVVEGNDLSLFYGNVSELTAITERRRFLPSELYSKMVQDCVVCCVDCLLVRYNPALRRKECLLVLRASEPVKGVWWLPGGRLLKGETFFAAAVRKAKGETGLDAVRPVQVLGVWNTFFPTSHWDDDQSKGTQTVNPIVLVELEQPGADVVLDNTSEQFRWIPLDPDLAKANGEDRYVLQALYRLRAWNPSYDSYS